MQSVLSLSHCLAVCLLVPDDTNDTNDTDGSDATDFNLYPSYNAYTISLPQCSNNSCLCSLFISMRIGPQNSNALPESEFRYRPIAYYR